MIIKEAYTCKYTTTDQAARDYFNQLINQNKVNMEALHRGYDADLEKIGAFNISATTVNPYNRKKYTHTIFDDNGDINKSFAAIQELKNKYPIKNNEAVKAVVDAWARLYGRDFKTGSQYNGILDTSAVPTSSTVQPNQNNSSIDQDIKILSVDDLMLELNKNETFVSISEAYTKLSEWAHSSGATYSEPPSAKELVEKIYSKQIKFRKISDVKLMIFYVNYIFYGTSCLLSILQNFYNTSVVFSNGSYEFNGRVSLYKDYSENNININSIIMLNNGSDSKLEITVGMYSIDINVVTSAFNNNEKIFNNLPILYAIALDGKVENYFGTINDLKPIKKKISDYLNNKF